MGTESIQGFIQNSAVVILLQPVAGNLVHGKNKIRFGCSIVAALFWEALGQLFLELFIFLGCIWIGAQKVSENCMPFNIRVAYLEDM